MTAPGRPSAESTGMARRRAGSRDRRRALLAAGAALVCIVAIGLGVRWLTTSPRFAVSRVESDRYRFTDRDTLEARMRLSLGRNIWTLDTAALADTLRALPWVRDVAIARRLPSTLRVRLREWRPLLLVEGGDGRRVMVADGRRLELPERLPPVDLPLLVERGAAPAGCVGAAPLVALMAAVGETGLENRSPVDFVLRDERGLSLVLAGGSRLVLGGDAFAKRLRRYLALSGRIAPGTTVDLRFQGQVYIEDPAANGIAGGRRKAEHGT